MAGNIAARKRKIEGGTKVKTGCKTCRIRKVKCDEDKPFCKKCVNTGRTCDGYQSPFKVFTSQSINNTHAHAHAIKSVVLSNPIQPTAVKTGHIGIHTDLLNRYFSTKTMFDVKLDCTEEARQVLQASLTERFIRHAILSLRALREDLETAGDDPVSLSQPTPSFQYGLQQYSMALGGLASNLSSLRSNGLNSALLCCQIFISIEQVQKNYAAMAQHVIRGLSIMHEYRARPSIAAVNKLVPAHHDRLPLLDVFVIKLFLAPCKFTDRPVTTSINETTSSACPISSRLQPTESPDLRILAPDMRTQLTRIAGSTLAFLDKVLRVDSIGAALQLLSKKMALLNSLESWLRDLENMQSESGSPHPELISISFLRLFHLILKIVLLGVLDFSPGIDAALRTENDRLQSLANNLGEKVRTYVTCSGTAGGTPVASLCIRGEARQIYC
ncbi:hypothetical protein DL95DRAFT_425716 [Leptodontidium sp. 2 PMI_412]|nr:hypothetical protein DL95DRAFT_425716 [Leptodontidium sp. 2 PMI_412]